MVIGLTLRAVAYNNGSCTVETQPARNATTSSLMLYSGEFDLKITFVHMRVMRKPMYATNTIHSPREGRDKWWAYRAGIPTRGYVIWRKMARQLCQKSASGTDCSFSCRKLSLDLLTE